MKGIRTYAKIDWCAFFSLLYLVMIQRIGVETNANYVKYAVHDTVYSELLLFSTNPVDVQTNIFIARIIPVSFPSFTQGLICN